MKHMTAFLLLLVLISHAWSAQFVFIDDIITFNATGYDLPEQRGPTNWVSPVNYVEGTVMMRYEIIEKPSSRTVMAQLCMWQDNNTADMKESCASCQATSTPKVYYFNYGRPSSWWKKVPLDYTRRFGMIYVMQKADACGSNIMMYESCGAYCYKGNDLLDHVPIRAKVLAVVVSKGSTFQPPEGWNSPITVAPPVMDPPPGTYAERQKIRMTSATPGAEIYYELYGSEPDLHSRKYEREVSVPITRTIKAVAYKHCTFSDTVTYTYTIGQTGMKDPAADLRVTAGTADGRTVRIKVDAEDVGSWLKAGVYNARGARVADLTESGREGNSVILDWNGRQADGAPAVPGVYLVRVRSNGAAGVARAVLVR